MSKKQISEGLNGLLKAPTQETPTQGATAAVHAPTRQVTYNLRAEILEKVRYIAFMDRKKNNGVVSEALEQYVTQWEKEHGEITVTV